MPFPVTENGDLKNTWSGEAARSILLAGRRRGTAPRLSERAVPRKATVVGSAVLLPEGWRTWWVMQCRHRRALFTGCVSC